MTALTTRLPPASGGSVFAEFAHQRQPQILRNESCVSSPVDEPSGASFCA